MSKMIMYDGFWTLENGVAVYRTVHGELFRYNYESLLFALENVKRERELYVTHEAYRKALDHFERGCRLFPQHSKGDKNEEV